MALPPLISSTAPVNITVTPLGGYAQLYIESVTPGGLVACCVGVGSVVGATMYVVSRSPVIAAAFGLLATWAPVAIVRFRLRQRRAELRDLWPDARR